MAFTDVRDQDYPHIPFLYNRELLLLYVNNVSFVFDTLFNLGNILS